MLCKALFVLGLVLACVEVAKCSLLIGAFNIKVFGDKKASNATLVNIIVEVVHRYDIVVIQEVRDSDLSATTSLMRDLNRDSPYVYRHIVSEPLGRSTYKERYLFIYRDERVSVVESFQYDDGCESCGMDTFNREPFVVKFASKFSAVPEFVLIPQHTSPDSAVVEIDALYDVAAYVQNHWNTDNILLLGDFNADCNYVLPSDWEKIRLHTDSQYAWLLPNSVDTTVGNTHCAYDRIVASGIEMKKAIIPGSARVYNFMVALNLQYPMALAVSDHFPVEVGLAGP
ncbi:deoxyribonuclease-1 [Amia ocellicauda]|uniref:deoxyribonuclease-1 n=1 Tax=Amia ocellicauda TaxID=2972642 RepID=UPI003463A5CA